MSRVLFQYRQTLPAWLVLKVNRFHFSQINTPVVLQDRNKPNPTQNSQTEHVHPIKRSKHKQQQLTDDRRKQTNNASQFLYDQTTAVFSPDVKMNNIF